MASQRIVVFIYLPGETSAVPAGVFRHDGDAGVGSFEYGRRYVERRGALAVDPVALPLGRPPREVTTNGGLYGAFRDGAPDYWGRLVIAAQTRSAVEAYSEMDFLLAANATRVGNLDFRQSPENEEPQLAPPHFQNLVELMTAADQIEAGIEPENHLLRLLAQGTSMGGARPKCAVEWNGDLWIAKFPAKGDTLDVPRIEYATMTLAASCGIRVPEVRLEMAGGKAIYLAKRFDRIQAEGGWARKGFLSALSLMQWDERERLVWDYAALADEMRRHMEQPLIEELFRRMVFNILVRNTDDHPRNHGFLVESEGRIVLSPAYDIVPALTREGVSADFQLAMKVGTTGREATLENALTRANRFGLSREKALGVIGELRERVRGWKDHFASVGVSDREIALLSRSFSQT